MYKVAFSQLLGFFLGLSNPLLHANSWVLGLLLLSRICRPTALMP
jgi:hypothetical protein